MPSSLDLHFGKCPRRDPFSVYRGRQSRVIPCTLLLVSLSFCLVCASCGAASSSDPPQLPGPTIRVQASSQQAVLGGTVQFNATVQNASSTAVNWSIAQTSGTNQNEGTIDSSGLYTAPNSLPAPATVTVMAVLQASPSVSGTASIAIEASLTLSPAIASIVTPQTLSLEVANSGVTASEVSWSATEGTISSTGLYSPPAEAGAYTITAALNANPNVTGQATVFVTDFPGTLTWRNDNSRSGVNSQELALAPATVSPSTFGRLFSCPIDGYAYAQPLYMPNLPIPGMGTHNVVFVATENNSVYAFDADTSPCLQLWQTSLGSSAILGGTLPIEGITGTPVIDRKTLTLYVVAASGGTSPDPNNSAQQLFALDLTMVPPAKQPPGAGAVIPPASGFYPSLVLQRAALLLNNGNIYIAFGSNGVPGDYSGWLFAYDATTLQQIGSFDVTPLPNTMGGIWQSGGGPSADSNGNVFVVTGKGPFNGVRTPESPSYSDSFLRFGVAQGLSSVADYFTPCDQVVLQNEGMDIGLGAGAPVLLPPSAGSASGPDLLVGGSKSGSIFVVNRDDMGGYVPGLPGCVDSPRVQTIAMPASAGPIMSTPLFWNNALYLAPGNGTTMNGYLMSFPLSAPGIFAPTPSTTQSPETLGPYGATPVISWNQANNDTSTAILWLIDSSGALATPNTAAILRAYDANNLSNEIYNSSMAANSRDTAGLAVKFTVPTVANGKVYVGTQKELDVYGLLH